MPVSPPKDRKHVDDLRGATRLALDATKGVTDLVEEMHSTIASGPKLLGRPLELPVRLITGAVYKSIRGMTGLVGASIDLALDRLAPLLGESAPGPERAAVLAAVNGVLGDYLEQTENPLAIEMQFRREGHPLPLASREALAKMLGGASFDAAPKAKNKLLVMVHGSCMADGQWLRNGHDHGAALERELGYTRVDLLYNSGRHISTNGEALAAKLETLCEAWPEEVEEIVLLTHSMGGLVSRSACHTAEGAALAWRGRLKSLVFLGVPHHGAPLERGGNWLEVSVGRIPYAAPLARLGRIRSAGVTDLRYGNLLAADWEGRDRFERHEDPRTPLPLPVDVACYVVAGSGSKGKTDGLVPVESALGIHELPERSLAFVEAHTRVFEGLGHIEMIEHRETCAQVREWLGAGQT